MVFHSLVVAASSVLNFTSTENRFELEPKCVTHNSFFYTAKVSMDFIVFDCCASYTVFLASKTKRAICCRKHNNCTPLTMGQKILSMLVEKSPKFVLLISAFEFHFPFKMEIVALILEKKFCMLLNVLENFFFFPSVNETSESYMLGGIK